MTQFPEGRISIRLVAGSSRPWHAELSSTRPLSAARVFEGKTVAQTLRVLPVLYRVCATAQAAAAAAAVESARRLTVSQADTIARDMLVMIETWREHMLRVLTSWPEASDSKHDPTVIADVFRLARETPAMIYPADDAFTPGGGRLAVDTDALPNRLDALSRLSATSVFGIPPAEWLALDNLTAAERWASSSRGAAADFVRYVLDQGWADAGRARVRAMPPLAPQELAARMTAGDVDDFVARPRWHGEVLETGAYARAAAHPLVAAARRAHGDALLARTFARLVEVATLPGRLGDLLERITATPADGAGEPAPGDGTGIGQAEAARGRLVHHVVLDGDRIASYRILAPTEWNFHPDGVLVRALGALPRHTGLRQLAGLVVEAVDPCVGYDLSVSDDA